MPESCPKLKVWGQCPDLEKLTPWAKLKRVRVLQFRNIVISKKLSGLSSPHRQESIMGDNFIF